MRKELTDEEYLQICKEDRRWWECERKRKFKNELSANRHLTTIKENCTPNSSAMHAYDCRYCDGWHVGTRKKRKKTNNQVLSESTLQSLRELKERLLYEQSNRT